MIVGDSDEKIRIRIEEWCSFECCPPAYGVPLLIRFHKHNYKVAYWDNKTETLLGEHHCPTHRIDLIRMGCAWKAIDDQMKE